MNAYVNSMNWIAIIRALQLWAKVVPYIIINMELKKPNNMRAAIQSVLEYDVLLFNTSHIKCNLKVKSLLYFSQNRTEKNKGSALAPLKIMASMTFILQINVLLLGADW